MSNDDKCPCVDGLPDPCTLCGAPADGVCEIDTLVGWKHRAQRAEAEARQLRALTEGDPYSIYYEAAEMRSELMHLRRWKLEATEVIESWELVYEALGDVGGLGQRRSDAVLAEVLRMKAELDRAQLRSIEASNPGIDMDEVRRVRLAYPDPERHETVSRAKYGASLASDIAADGGAAVAEGAEDRGQTDG